MNDTDTTVSGTRAVEPAQLVELARAAKEKAMWEREIEQKKRQEQERLEKAARLKKGLWENLGIDVEPTEATIEVGGLTFGVGLAYYSINLIRPCVRCGQNDYCAINDITDLGFALDSEPVCDDWEAHRTVRTESGTVQEIAPEPTPLERLGQALLDYITENNTPQEF